MVVAIFIVVVLAVAAWIYHVDNVRRARMSQEERRVEDEYVEWEMRSW